MRSQSAPKLYDIRHPARRSFSVDPRGRMWPSQAGSACRRLSAGEPESGLAPSPAVVLKLHGPSLLEFAFPSESRHGGREGRTWGPACTGTMVLWRFLIGTRVQVAF